MKHHPWPKQIAITFCGACSLITFADHVNRLDSIPHRFCSHCGASLGVALYTQGEVVQPWVAEEK
jgi:hypothetical protein